MEIKKKQIIIAFTSSLVLLTSLFISTMLNHQKSIDWGYLSHAFPQIMAISLVPVIIVALFKIDSLFKSGIIGLIVGLTAAIAYVQLSIPI